MPDQTKRSATDVLRDLNTIRKGSMPTGDKAAPSRTYEREGPAHVMYNDPVENRRYQLALKRNSGRLKDVNLPLSSASPEVKRRIAAPRSPSR